MSGSRQELFVGLGMVALAGFAWFILIPIGIDLPASVEFRALSPDFWPHVVTILLAVSGAIVAVQAYRDGDAPEADPAVDDEDGVEVQFEFPFRYLRVAIAVVGLFAVYLLIPSIGIVAAGVLIIIVSTFSLGERRFKYTVPLAVALPAILYVFFVHVANIPLPLGVFEAFR